MNTSFRRRLVAQRGLTLIELVVVLAILVALAGLIIGNFPGIVKRAGRSSSATSVGDINRAVQYRYTTALTFPNSMDSLLTGAALATYMPTNAIGALGGTNVTVAALAAADANALIAAGITTAYDLDPASGITDATWSSTALGTTRAIASGAQFATITPAYATNVFGTKAGLTGASATTYVVFGLGSRCTLVGPNQTMIEAPTHFGDSAAQNPKDFYQRYAMVFAVDTVGGVASARYVGAAAIEPGGLTAGEENLKQYWNAN